MDTTQLSALGIAVRSQTATEIILEGTASTANYYSAVKNLVTFRNDGPVIRGDPDVDDPTKFRRTIEIEFESVSESGVGTANAKTTLSFLLLVSASNDPPVITQSAPIQFVEGSTASGQSSRFGSDPEGDELTFEVVCNSRLADFVFHANGTYSVKGKKYAYGIDTVLYRVKDSKDAYSGYGTINLDITNNLDAPDLRPKGTCSVRI